MVKYGISRESFQHENDIILEPGHGNKEEKKQTKCVPFNGNRGLLSSQKNYCKD